MSTAALPVRTPPGKAVLRELRSVLVSLELTIALLGLSMILVFVATLDQVNLGIWAVQEKYFRSFVVYTQVGRVVLPVFPGGYTIGGLLLVNLVAAHLYRFRFSWRKSGIQLIHVGLILLLVGELLTGLWQKDYYLRLDEGQTSNYAESVREHELALIDATDPNFDDVVSIPEPLVATKAPVQHPKLPFRVIVKAYYPNSSLHLRSAAPDSNDTPAANTGMGGHVAAAPQPITHRPNERNVPSGIIELFGTTGSLGTFLVSAHLPSPQTFTVDGRTWRIALRIQRSYLPYSLTLLKFSHDRYAGTEIPKNFSSKLRLTTPAGEDREVLIYMNNPLRHAGLTFYQAGFENNDRTTVLQVVRNPSWIMPYLACGLMTAGLALQFGIHLFGFVWERRRRTADATSTTPQRAEPREKPLPADDAVPAIPRGAISKS
jgi:hypothetical protein